MALLTLLRTLGHGLHQARLAEERFHERGFRARLREDTEAALAEFSPLPAEERPVRTRTSQVLWWNDWAEVMLGLPIHPVAPKR